MIIHAAQALYGMKYSKTKAFILLWDCSLHTNRVVMRAASPDGREFGEYCSGKVGHFKVLGSLCLLSSSAVKSFSFNLKITFT